MFAIDPIPPANPKEKTGFHLKPGEGLLQYQRWLPLASIGNNQEPVADWVVADVVARVGHYLGGQQFVNLPIWSSEYNRYILRQVPPEAGSKNKEIRRGVVMDPTKPGPQYIVVAIEGGILSRRYGARQIDDEAATEILLLDDSGVLQVRKSSFDRQDKDRKKRESAWMDWVKQTEEISKSVDPATVDPKSVPMKKFE